MKYTAINSAYMSILGSQTFVTFCLFQALKTRGFSSAELFEGGNSKRKFKNLQTTLQWEERLPDEIYSKALPECKEFTSIVTFTGTFFPTFYSWGNYLNQSPNAKIVRVF